MLNVLFYIERNPAADSPEYKERASHLVRIVSKDPDFISIKGFTAADGELVYIIKFKTEQALENWRNNPEHKEAMGLGKEKFYKSYQMEVCPVTRKYAFPMKKGNTRYSTETQL